MPVAPKPKSSATRPAAKTGKAARTASGKRKSGNVLGLALICGILISFLWMLHRAKEIAHLNGRNFDEVYPHYETPPGTPIISVLFVGNSYTLVNNMPGMVQAVAASDTANPVVINTYSFGTGGVSLRDIWNKPNSMQALGAQKWDYVVLQDGSGMALDSGNAQVMHDAIVAWDGAIKAAGSRTVLYETWARKPGSDWYDVRKHPEDSHYVSPEHMQEMIDQAYNAFASEIGASLVPVGDYWAMCRDQPGVPDLYHPDATHPSFAGDYLISLLFYRALTGHKLDHVSYIAPGLSSKQAELIRKCASYGS